MKTWETFTMSRKEVPRAGLLKAALAGTITNAQGALALTGELARIIGRRWAGRVMGNRMVRWVFHHRGGRPVAPTSLRNWWREAAAAAGQPGLLFHDLRRSGVRNMIRAGVTELVAMSVSGHQSASVFRRYNITSVDDQRRALAATQGYVAAQQKPSARKGQRG